MIKRGVQFFLRVLALSFIHDSFKIEAFEASVSVPIEKYRPSLKIIVSIFSISEASSVFYIT